MRPLKLAGKILPAGPTASTARHLVICHDVTSVRGDASPSGPVVQADLSSAWLEALVRLLQEVPRPAAAEQGLGVRGRLLQGKLRGPERFDRLVILQLAKGQGRQDGRRPITL